MKAAAEPGTRERILQVAEHFLGEHGYHGTRLHEIARQVGIQKASLFHYFPSKMELYRAVLAEGFGDTETAIRAALDCGGPPIETLRAIVRAYVQLVAAHPARTKMLLRQSLGDSPLGAPSGAAPRLLGLVTAFIAEAQRQRVFAPIDPLALVLGAIGMAAFFFTSAPVLAPGWLGGDGRDGVDRVTQVVTAVIERTLAPAAPARPSARLRVVRG